MRYTAEQKEQMRQKMLDAIGRGFRSQGYAGIGVDGLAKEAGVTSGAIYSQFGSKDAAFMAALVAGLDEVISAIPQYQETHGEKWIEAFAAYYLGKAHREDLACGCAMATLTPEVIRSGADTQTVLEAKMQSIIALIIRGLAGGTEEEKQCRAWAMLCTLVGGLTFSRAMQSEDISAAIASAAEHASLQAAGPACKADK